MTSSAERGRVLEKRATKQLTGVGYEVHRARRAALFLGKGRVISQPNDIFGCFDLIAVHRRHLNVRLIQVTTQTNLGHRRKKVANWGQKWLKVTASLSAEVWGWGTFPKRLGRKTPGFVRDVYEQGEWLPTSLSGD